MDWGSYWSSPERNVGNLSPSTNVNTNSSNNKSNKKTEPKKEEPVFKTQQMKNLEAYKAKYANLNYGQALQLLSDTEEQRKRELPEGYRPLNLNQFLQQKGVSSDPNVPVLAFQAQSLQDVQVAKPIDLSTIYSSDQLKKSQKATAEREFLKNQYNVSNIPVPSPQEKENPAARRMGFGQGGGVANLGLTGYQTITEPEPSSFTDFVFGRINTPIQETIVQEPKVIEETKTVKPDYSKVIIAAVGIFAVLGFVIWRIKK